MQSTAAKVRAGDAIFCVGCHRWEHVTWARPHALGRVFIRTDHHDAYKKRDAAVEILPRQGVRSRSENKVAILRRIERELGVGAHTLRLCIGCGRVLTPGERCALGCKPTAAAKLVRHKNDASSTK